MSSQKIYWCDSEFEVNLIIQQLEKLLILWSKQIAVTNEEHEILQKQKYV